MIDMVPKAITLTLVNFAKENLQRVLLEHLYSPSYLESDVSPTLLIILLAIEPEILEELLKESPDIVTRRKECVKMVGALNQAEAMYVLQRVGGIDNEVLTLRSFAWTVSLRCKQHFGPPGYLVHVVDWNMQYIVLCYR
jgi:hypothetical protein